MILKSVILIAGLVLTSRLSVQESRILALSQPQFAMCLQRTIEQSTPCPVFEVQCPDTEKAGKTIVFRVPGLYGPFPSRTPNYRWRISGGRIIKGKGTDTIVVDTRHVRAESIKGRVKVSEFPRDCPLVASCSVKLLRN
jgi:hypothetical protein